MKEIEYRRQLVNQVLKSIKKSLPRTCTFLSLYKRRQGDTCIRAVVNKTNYYYTIPQDFNLTEASFERIRSLILDECIIPA
jgi:hypothetical protein